ncbi:transmembrane protein 134 isoform X3 [Myotis daubentonii]|uniref:transmembrane protein 134 isoform X3 n=1 Tax=Myotis daubentonii TaxID=98922 RepID=UPI00287391E0|nr:transmembrane protein 134 isoform X3 [Myotis daubentonii]
MSAPRPQFSIDDAFELSLEDAGPGPESSGVARFGPLHFERRARFEAADEDKQSRLRYQGCWPNILRPQLPVVLQYHQQQHPALLQRLLQLDSAPFDPEEPQGSAGLLPAAAAGVGLSLQTFPRACPGPCSENSLASCPGTFSSVLILVGVGLEVAPSPGVSSAIFFVPGFLLLVPGVYHVIFIYCAVKGHRGFQFFYLPYFEK